MIVVIVVGFRNRSLGVYLAALVEVLESGAQSLTELESHFDATENDGPPAPPAPLLWMPPQAWHQTPASTWGTSPDAEQFRTLSVPGAPQKPRSTVMAD